jgi:hypothetical protein
MRLTISKLVESIFEFLELCGARKQQECRRRKALRWRLD